MHFSLVLEKLRREASHLLPSYIRGTRGGLQQGGGWAVVVSHVFLDQPIPQSTIRVRSQDVYREEDLLDGDQFAVSSSGPEV